MKVLHCPVNVGSRTSHTVRALREKGIDAVGLIYSNFTEQSPEGLEVIHPSNSKRFSINWAFSKVKWLYYFIKYLNWCDIIHWYFGASTMPYNIDIKIVQCTNKPAIVEWQGSDIRIPEVEEFDNRYFSSAFHNGYEYENFESKEKAIGTQKRFKNAGFNCIAPIGMMQYVQKDIFPLAKTVPRRLILKDYQPNYPSPGKFRPLIVHCPTAPIAKGTNAVIRAINVLKRKYDFEFLLLKDINRKELLTKIRKADIVLDQFVLGDFGMVSLEAMSFGKPVICFIKPSLISLYPIELPIINANQDNLISKLEMLLNDGNARYEIGLQGREYVEKNHNALNIADKIIEIYKEILSH
jgi:glycosyltransferase involved in cell wall biosynthesis